MCHGDRGIQCRANSNVVLALSIVVSPEKENYERTILLCLFVMKGQKVINIVPFSFFLIY